MRRHGSILLILAFAAGTSSLAAPPRFSSGSVFLHPKLLAVGGEETWTLEAGDFFVPENRARPGSRTISLAFYRFASISEKPSSPVFILAGGPGASALDEFMEDADARALVRYLRSVSDVVLFDQRGAGHSRPKLDCPEYVRWGDAEVSSRSGYVSRLKEATLACRNLWQQQGVDLPAYNTIENAADADGLRRALGYERMTLVANSYGTHLAIALMRLHGPSIDRAVLYGVEGPDHTYDVPSEVLGSLEQIAEAAQRSPQLAGRIPSGGLLAALKTVEERLDREPARATVIYDGKSRTVTLSRFDIQRIARNGIHDRSHLEWPALIIEMFNGDFRRAAQRVLEVRDWPIEGAMFFMMDCASGISAERLERIRNSALEKQAGETLGDLNVVYSSCDVWGSPDLGVQFRSPLVSNVPVLLVQGTWDASTPFGNAVEVAAGLSHATLLRVEGGTHFALVDAFGSWPPMRSLLERFLRGRPITAPSSIQLGEPVFVQPNGPG